MPLSPKINFKGPLHSFVQSLGVSVALGCCLVSPKFIQTLVAVSRFKNRHGQLDVLPVSFRFCSGCKGVRGCVHHRHPGMLPPSTFFCFFVWLAHSSGLLPPPPPKYEGAGAASFCLARFAPGCRFSCLLELSVLLYRTFNAFGVVFWGFGFGRSFGRGDFVCFVCLFCCVFPSARKPSYGLLRSFVDWPVGGRAVVDSCVVFFGPVRLGALLASDAATWS